MSARLLGVPMSQRALRAGTLPREGDTEIGEVMVYITHHGLPLELVPLNLEKEAGLLRCSCMVRSTISLCPLLQVDCCTT